MKSLADVVSLVSNQIHVDLAASHDEACDRLSAANFWLGKGKTSGSYAVKGH